jgi:hypothetical protein
MKRFGVERLAFSVQSASSCKRFSRSTLYAQPLSLIQSCAAGASLKPRSGKVICHCVIAEHG